MIARNKTMFDNRMAIVHEVSNFLRLKANAEIVKCTDNGFNTAIRLRTDDKIIDIKVKVYDLDEKNDRSPGGTGKAVERIV